MSFSQVLFENEEEYNRKKTIMYKNIKETIINCVVTDTFEYKHMNYYGLTPRQAVHIEEILKNELNTFSENQCNEWCSTTTTYIIWSLRGFFDSLIKINKINDFTAEEIVVLIYNTIIYQLDNDGHSPYLLEDIVKFKEILEE